MSRGAQIRKHLYYARNRLEKCLDVASRLDSSEVDPEFIGSILENIVEIQEVTSRVDEMICRKSTQNPEEEAVA